MLPFFVLTAMVLAEPRLAQKSTLCDRPERLEEPACIVASEESEKYTIILMGKYDPVALCVQAGLAATAYLQALDEVNYRIWKREERRNCDDAKRLYGRSKSR